MQIREEKYLFYIDTLSNHKMLGINKKYSKLKYNSVLTTIIVF